MPCYSFFMQANSIINDDFTATIQSDEFAAEYEAYLDDQEKNYWREIEAKGNWFMTNAWHAPRVSSFFLQKFYVT